MKKVLIIIGLLLITGCTSSSEIGTWVQQNNDDKYIFNEDGTCAKITNATVINCTYTKDKTVINVYVNGTLYESGQYSPKSIVMGSELYKKEK